MILVLLLSILLGAVGQFLLKLGAVRLTAGSWLATLGQMLLVPQLLLGLLCFGSSFILWVFVMRRLTLSAAYPMVSLSYIITALLGVYYLHEPWNWQKSAGLLLIMAGVALLNLGTARG
ncbi:MAG: DMT family transporter [Mycobacterium leprae]